MYLKSYLGSIILFIQEVRSFAIGILFPNLLFQFIIISLISFTFLHVYRIYRIELQLGNYFLPSVIFFYFTC